MYRVLLVDDEATSLRYFRNVIESYVPRLRVVAEAENGLDAARILAECKPDLLVTDIRMPGMDGIELAKLARARDADLPIVIVSGYSEFEYAKSAIAIGVEDYLLKPLKLRTTVALLESLCDKLDEAYEERRYHALRQLLAGCPFEDAWHGQLFEEKIYGIIVIRAGNLPARRTLPAKPESLEVVLPARASCWLLRGRDDAELVVVQSGRVPTDETIATLEAAWAQEAKITAIVKRTVALPLLRSEVTSSLIAMDSRLVIGMRQVIDLDSIRPDEIHAISPDALRRIQHCLAAGDWALLKDMLFSWAVEWEKRRLSQQWMEASVDQIAECAVAALPGLQARRMQIREELAEVFQVARTVGEVFSGTWDILFAGSAQESAGRHVSQVLIGEIQTYIRAYCNNPLSMQSVSAAFGISQTFLGRLFRRDTDTTFGEFLTAARMSLACELIGLHPDMKLKDVARCSGYEDPSYFTKVFTKYHGITPSQFAEKKP